MLTYPPDLEEYVEKLIASGEFRDRDEFAVEAARRFREMQQRHAQLKADIQLALDEADQGLSEPLDIEEIIAELEAEFDEQGRPQ